MIEVQNISEEMLQTPLSDADGIAMKMQWLMDRWYMLSDAKSYSDEFITIHS